LNHEPAQSSWSEECAVDKRFNLVPRPVPCCCTVRPLFVLLPAQYKLYFLLRKFLLCFRAPIFLSCALPQIPNDRSPRFTPFPFRHKTPVHPSGCYASLSGPQCVSLRCRVLTNKHTDPNTQHSRPGTGQERGGRLRCHVLLFAEH